MAEDAQVSREVERHCLDIDRDLYRLRAKVRILEYRIAALERKSGDR